MKAFLFMLYCLHFSVFHDVVVLAGLGKAGQPLQHAAKVVCAR